MTAARAAQLDALGFAWDFVVAAMVEQKGKGLRVDAGYKAQLAKLKAYTGHHGDCNVLGRRPAARHLSQEQAGVQAEARPRRAQLRARRG
jgi:hypothetical protein